MYGCRGLLCTLKIYQGVNMANLPTFVSADPLWVSVFVRPPNAPGRNVLLHVPDQGQLVPQVVVKLMPAEDKSKFGKFKATNQFLMSAWGATLVCLAYLRRHVVAEKDFIGIMEAAAVLVATSFVIWFGVFISLVTKNPDTLMNNKWFRALLFVGVYGNALEALGIAFCAIYFPPGSKSSGNGHTGVACGIAGCILVSVGAMEGFFGYLWDFVMVQKCGRNVPHQGTAQAAAQGAPPVAPPLSP